MVTALVTRNDSQLPVRVLMALAGKEREALLSVFHFSSGQGGRLSTVLEGKVKVLVKILLFLLASVLLQTGLPIVDFQLHICCQPH